MVLASIITLAIASSMTTSLPGRTGTHSSALPAQPDSRGSTTTVFMADLLAAHRALPIEPARRLLAFEVVGAAVEEELRVLEVRQDAGAGPRQLVGNVAGGFAGGGPVHHVRRAERLGEGLAELFLDQVFALAVLPYQLGRIVGLDGLQATGDGAETPRPTKSRPTSGPHPGPSSGWFASAAS